MSSFTPRAWKTPAADVSETGGEKFRAHHVVDHNNLPIARTSFIGRERDVADVKKLLERHPLVTLVGSGGVGKTRLALQVGAELLERFPDGVWFVDLAPLTDPELVGSATAQALGMGQQGGRLDEAVPPWLKRKALLLIFDNCEHVIDTVAPLADAILRTAQKVRIVATSRQALAIGGEGIHRIPSLPGFDAVALFVDRATANDPTFALADEMAPIVLDICRRLDGIPLAIELAAARVKVLSLPHLAERLDERFRLLTSGSRTALPRQKTLGALIDWSYDLLSPQEQLLFARLGIFAGGFGLEAAIDVCGFEGLNNIDILDLLGSLTDKSLVVADTSGEREHYRLLESTAAYALDKLRSSGEREAMARRHAEYFREQALAADARFGTGSSYAWVAETRLQLDNIRSALTWSLTQGNDIDLGGTIAGALGALWLGGGLEIEGRYWIGLALERISESEQSRIAARLWVALSTLSGGKHAYDAAERAMRLYASVGDASGAGRAQRWVAYGLFQMGRFDEAKIAIDQALAASRENADAFDAGGCLNVQAFVARALGDLPAARSFCTQALAAFKALGDEDGVAIALGNAAETEFSAGNPKEALSSAKEALEIHRRGENATTIAIDHVNIAAYRIALDDFTGARESALEGLSVARQARIEAIIDIALQHLATVAALGGDACRGARMIGYVGARYAELRLQNQPTEQWCHNKLMAALREALSADTIATLAAEGAGWSEDRAVEEALKVS